MKPSNCPNCKSEIRFIDIFTAGLPNQIKCGACSSKVRFDINPYLTYPVVISALLISILLGIYLGNKVADSNIIPIKDRYVIFGVTLIFAAAIESIFAFWLLKFKSVLGNSPKQNMSFNSANENKTWDKVFDVASLILDGERYKTVELDLKKIQDFKNIESEYPEYFNYAREKFGNKFVEWLEDDLEEDDIPCAAFKTVLHGHGVMAYMDSSCIEDQRELFGQLNLLLEKFGLQEISGEEKTRIQSIVDTMKGDSARIINAYISELDKIADVRNRDILWFDENGDSYSYFLTVKGVSDKLNGMKLDTNHVFKKPKY